ncbi:hypothetical protein [Pseudofrankia sp. BMG5.37]|uniref:hypothetical protein n=1 Tax=Pseudofrankia sp. BMG5.37 TaxID=3050035 RepID=UPI002894505D|nr:hypothetical protein [Pseudofrankia sp. BMG5.37]MDT3443548.1 hypothetical protein [Pseudofrankia sp. BMG5.37]
MDLFVGSRERPAWFDPTIAAVLDGSGAVLAADGPRVLEEATVELVGGQIRHAVRDVRRGLWVDWWFAQLTEATAARIHDELDRGGTGWEGPWRLLHGLAAIGSPALASGATTAARRLAAKVARAGGRGEARWLPAMRRLSSTGEVWHLCDAYGSRIGVIAGFTYPGGVDPSVFLFDVDACGMVTVVNAGVYDDVAQAVAAWRAFAGESASDAEPAAAQRADELVCLAYADHGGEIFQGDESDSALDNWFRTSRRLHELADALRRRGTPLPRATNLHRDLDAGPLVDAFATWYSDRHGNPPAPEPLDALAYEWIEGRLPGTWHAASPHRVRHIRGLISDWVDDPVTKEASALLPDWIRWHAEQTDLPEHLLAASLAAVADNLDRPDLGAPCMT